MPKVLIVEDNEGIRHLLNKKLNKMHDSMSIELFDNGEDALNYLNDNTPDLILLDYVLPDIQAEKVIKHLEKINKKIPFIIFTGQGNEKIAVELMKMGAVDYVVKDDLFWEFILPSIERALHKIKTEQELYKTQSELKESELRLKQVINLVPHFIYARNLQGQIIIANTAFMVAMGVSTLEELNMEIDRHRFLVLSKDDKEVITKEIMKLMYDESFVDFTGEEKFLQTSKIPFTVYGSEEKAILAVSIDVTAQKKVEEKIKDLNTELEIRVLERTKELENKNGLLNKINKAQDDILGIVAHDLRQPLTIIMTSLELMRMKIEEVSSDDVEMISKIEKACHKMNTLIKDLLDISMLEAESYKLDLKPRELYDILSELVTNFRPQFEKKNIEFIFTMNDTSILLNLNLDRFWQIISNLISNAMKFTNEDGRVELKVYQTDDENNIKIEVNDNGIGMSKERVIILFEKFTKASRLGTTGEKSTGLGMSITKRLVELHQGNISVESKVEVGTKITLDFPKN